MFENFNTYISSTWDKYIRPRGIRAGVLRALRLVGNSLNAVESFTAVRRYSTRPGFRTVAVKPTSIRPYAVLAGSAAAEGSLVAGEKDKPFKYIVELPYTGLTALMRSVGSTKVLLRNVDFYENDGTYLFYDYPGVAGTRTITSAGEAIVFVALGGDIQIKHGNILSTVCSKCATSFIRNTTLNAIGNARRAIGTASSVISAITGIGTMLCSAVVRYIWKEADRTYMVTDDGTLHQASINVKNVAALNNKATQGSVWSTYDTDNIFVVPTGKHYTVVFSDTITSEQYPDVYAAYPDVFVNNTAIAADLRSYLELRGIRTVFVNMHYNTTDSRALDSKVLKTSNDIIVQRLS